MNPPSNPGAALASCRCPDCNSELDLAVVSPGVLRVVIRHDATCPTFRALTEGRP